MKNRSAFFLLAALLAPTPALAGDCVVLLHGLGRTHLSMTFLQWSLEDAGYAVWNRGYPSTTATVEELSAVVGDAVAECRRSSPKRIHFVTHSMGGILLRQWFQQHALPDAGRVVMLAPPNHGSEIVDTYHDSWWFKAAMGPAAQQLGTAPDSLPNRLAPVRLEIGVIAGRGISDPWFSSVFTGEHDGKVSVASARLAEMKELRIVDSGHTFIMNSPAVIAQVKTFLEKGTFGADP